MVESAAWPTFADIYSHVRDGNAELFSAEDLLGKARVLQLALQTAKRGGRFTRLAAALDEGQKGMEHLVWTDYLSDGAFAFYHEKTAGDMVQSAWCRLHLPHMGLCFQCNSVQVAFAKWINLPFVMLPEGLAKKVEKWSEHSLAHFQEMVTLFLPSALVNLYLNVCTNFFVNFEGVKKEICRFRNDLGLLRCDKKVSTNYPGFCCHAHHADMKKRSLAAFNAEEYGPEYVDLCKNDMVVILEHVENGNDWV